MKAGKRHRRCGENHSGIAENEQASYNEPDCVEPLVG
jgi:hypothetical protein